MILILLAISVFGKKKAGGLINTTNLLYTIGNTTIVLSVNLILISILMDLLMSN